MQRKRDALVIDHDVRPALRPAAYGSPTRYGTMVVSLPGASLLPFFT